MLRLRTVLVLGVALLQLAALVRASAQTVATPTQPGPSPQPPSPPNAWAPVKPAPPALKGSQAETLANTTTIARPTNDSRTSGQITFSAHLTDDGAALADGLHWRIYRDKPGPDGKLRLLSSHSDAAPQLRLDVGDYLVNAAYGRANLTRKITVAAGKAAAEKFVLSAGGLRVTATLASGDAAADGSILYAILSDERDQFGNRIPIMTGAKPGLVVRLNAGIYQIHSVYGDANASVRGEITVEPGKITDATLTHHAAKITFRLVSRAGGEALADTQWSIAAVQGDLVKESVGAIPTHVLAPGSYIATARRNGQTFKRDFSVASGDNVYVEVVSNP